MAAELEIEGFVGGLTHLQKCLHGMIVCKGHQMAFELGGGIHAIGKSLGDFFKEVDEARKSFVLLDENGKPEAYVYDSEDKDYCEKYDPSVVLKSTQTIGAKVDPEKSNDAKVYEEQINKEKIKVTLKKSIDMKKVEKLAGEGVFEGVDISPLFEFFK